MIEPNRPSAAISPEAKPQEPGGFHEAEQAAGIARSLQLDPLV